MLKNATDCLKNKIQFKKMFLKFYQITFYFFFFSDIGFLNLYTMNLKFEVKERHVAFFNQRALDRPPAAFEFITSTLCILYM